ncbi:aminomethyl-transferring glycine dehydrogenase [Arachidicoccus terrestris]|uniref:aminomethyl-transferring glycine dehydrogenase n=1 Tax=Arachidicoccus terrestris TaxID=2875539 RepID=UPI001CC42D0D|nr:aminomethyl-transferring glycine dehydrogenase [Arachidicoccus terrestris]UAY54519.1 aminomethyl-transferring glycine dehydrogenase [Arachidicoccus terrestris]
MNLFDAQSTEFIRRHIGPNEAETRQMLETIGESSTQSLVEKTIPKNIHLPSELDLPASISEQEYLQDIWMVASKNKVFKTYIGQGYYNTITPSVILRNVFENPGWYTSYTPYQAEISQGRLESLLNFQTVVSDLTGLELAGASLLDEATAAAEAMAMLFHHVNPRTTDKPRFFVDNQVFQQTKDVLVTRAKPVGIELVFGDYQNAGIDNSYFGALVQYPNSSGTIEDYRRFIEDVHYQGGYIVMATDLLALTLLTSPGELGADVAIGSAQRFGVPLGFGGPHAAFFSTKETFKRGIPGRIIGISVDAQGNNALRMALQTREQHIKREKATSNICTAQALLANMAAMYAVYHGPEGLKNIASRINVIAEAIEEELTTLGFEQLNNTYFDTLRIRADRGVIEPIALQNQINFQYYTDGTIGISIDETTTQKDALDIVFVFASSKGTDEATIGFDSEISAAGKIPAALQRTSAFLTHPVFNSHHSETQMMRYIKKLEKRDLALNTSMISLGSCTMKLNAATEMIPLSWPEFASIHPFVPQDQAAGYKQVIDELSSYLSTITQFDGCSLQPNSGAQGEFAGLNTIMEYHRANNQEHRNIVLIPISAHGTNPASAVMAGMKVVVVKSDEKGLVDVEDLRNKAEQYKDTLGALMITYPSTYGIFEESIREICEIIHDNGGQVYMDGANMNAQVGYTAPGYIGADVCHLNLHKTFAIPHGGGGPGVGPICAKQHLLPFLPGHFSLDKGQPVSAAAYGSASILLISYAYIRMLGAMGVKKSTEYAILNANYMKVRLAEYFQIMYAGKNGTCAHEFIVDLRPFKTSAGIEAEDVAKRLMDYGFHAPTMSFPVPGTIMIEPTESEDKAELDRFCDAMINIYKEIIAVQSGEADKTDNVLKNAPHTQHVICMDNWEHSYSRQSAAFPLEYIRESKFWPAVARINNTYGDRNLICTCAPVESYAEAE